MRELISIDQADAKLHQWVDHWRNDALTRDEAVPLSECVGRRLAQAVAVDRPLPPYDRVMMDGIVVRADDWSAGVREFDLVGAQPAGAPSSTAVDRGAAVEVMTGAVCPLAPDDAVVVPVERLVGGMPAIGGRVVIDSSQCHDLAAGGFVHRCGVDASAGEVLLDVGVVIGPAEVGVIASCGIARVRVSDRVKVAVISTGDELVDITDQPEVHQIRRSNDVVISSFAAIRGVDVVTCRHVGDERADVVSVIAELEAIADVVLISGGASMGRRDWVPTVLTDRCGDPLFHGVKQRPGKPFGVWDGGSTLFCALPGNPVSVLACLCRHIGPLLAAMNGRTHAHQTRVVDAPVRGLPDFGLLKPVADVTGDRVAWLKMRNSGDFAGLNGLAGFVELPVAGNAPANNTRLDFYSC